MVMKKMLAFVLMAVALLAVACQGASAPPISFDKLDGAVQDFLADRDFMVGRFLELAEQPYHFVATVPGGQEEREVLVKEIIVHSGYPILAEVFEEKGPKWIVYDVMYVRETDEKFEEFVGLLLSGDGEGTDATADLEEGDYIVEIRWKGRGFGEFLNYAIIAPDGELKFEAILTFSSKGMFRIPPFYSFQ